MRLSLGVGYAVLFFIVCIVLSVMVSAVKKEPFTSMEQYSRSDVIPYRNIYETDCVRLYGEDIKNKSSFDNYHVERDSNDKYYLNGIPLDKMPRTLENCRRIYEFIQNSEKEASGSVNTTQGVVDLPAVQTNKLKTLDGLAKLCEDSYGVDVPVDTMPYTYYVDRDGRGVLNGTSLDKMRMTRENCRVIRYANTKVPTNF